MRRYKQKPWDHWEVATITPLSEQLGRGEDITAELRRICHANALALGFEPAPLPAEFLPLDP